MNPLIILLIIILVILAILINYILIRVINAIDESMTIEETHHI